VIDVDAEADDPRRPFANLVPIVEALVGAGNVLGRDSKLRADCGFYMTQGGWQCDLELPIDFALVLGRFKLPASIEASEAFDTILDRLSWCAIEGPGADEARRERGGLGR